MSDGKRKQPMPGRRRDVTDGYETVEFARRRTKNRKRRDQAKASRRKNRG